MKRKIEQARLLAQRIVLAKDLQEEKLERMQRLDQIHATENREKVLRAESKR